MTKKNKEKETIDSVTNENNKDTQEPVEEMQEEVHEETQEDTSKSESEKIKKLKQKLEETTLKSEENYTLAQRVAAEFDNFKKRTLKEKEKLYNDSISDAVAAFLPVLDNLERAMQAAEQEENNSSIKEGVQLVYRQFKETMIKLGVEEIETVGKSFNPEIHNAVMHIDDEQYGESEIIEEFQKGYKLKDRVIRHSVVKVAN